ncbi:MULTISPECIES: TonB-dependent receptor [unclassified Pseudoalteromonas]|uniref:TonB-dependent receptor n=1 Tax=unclassified Pseudoalteromonas TaxID=194690 RepID=UPI003014672D
MHKKLLATPLLCSAMATTVTAANEIEVIEVYAQKRKQPIDEVAIAVKSLSGEVLQQAKLKDTTELGHLVSNVKVSQNAAEGTPPAINIRGVGLVDYNTANTSPVGMYLDGVSVGSANNQIVNLFDIEQMDVLKGPQGTLFGRNSTGGAILLRTARPQDGRFGYISAGAGSDELSKARAMFNYSLNDTSAVRFAASHNNYDYTTYNIYPDSPEAGMEQNDLRLSYLGEFEQFSVFVKLDYGHWNGLVQPVGNIGVIANPMDGSLCSAQAAGSLNCFDLFGFNSGSDDFWAVSVNNEQAHHSISKGITTEINYFLDDNAEVIYLGAFNRLDRQHGFNCDGSPANLCEGELGLKNERLVNELRYESGNDGSYLTVGAFHLEERIYQDNFNDLLRDLRATPLRGNATNFFYDNDIKVTSMALFGQYEFDVSDKLALTLGLRFSDEEVDYDSFSYVNVMVNDDLNGIFLPSYSVAGKESDTSWSGKAALKYRLDQDKSVYYSFANGTKSGGYNGGYLLSEEQALQANYGPESLNAHEVGLKAAFQELGLQSNFAAFYYDYKDQQVFMNQASDIPGTPPYQLLENVGESTIYGVELENAWRITPQATLNLDIGYIPEANFAEFVDPVGNRLTDNRLPFTSKWNVSGQLRYAFNWQSVAVKTRVGFDYQSDYFFDQNESDYAMQPDYTLWSAAIQFKYQQFQLDIWGKNLLDEEYSHLKFDLRDFLGMLEDFKGDGRRVGVDVSYYF